MRTILRVLLRSSYLPTPNREARKAGDLSQRTYWDELSRRGVLGPAFDPDEELERLLEEVPGDAGEDEIVEEVTPPELVE